MSLYHRDPAEGLRLDGRKLTYQFDSDVVIPWGELARPGRHLPVGFLGDAGFEVPPLDPEAAALLDWAYGLSVCEGFIAAERFVLRFINDVRPDLPESRSIALLSEEEVKHIRIFERYGAQLRSCRPDQCELFDRSFAPRLAKSVYVSDPAQYPSPTALHYMCWLNALFFEEYTIFLDERLGDDPEGVQPVWRAVHAAHRREETQHVVTDEHFLAALPLDDKVRREMSELFTIYLLHHFDIVIGVGGAVAMLAAVRPDLPIRRPGRITRSRLFQEILTHRHFKRTRRFVPFAELI